ncbi:cysteine proteinase [Calocera viscosa TUFC12733]|uniref:ubiquitinyl hydrolase 1 n=1 Tax=Calocera viscosa (strain TUFC12733) TaxID=1330018 RepID=A0A167HDR5_CALVF|nr:cysteine proteinase [Calocera viscosa TUFC12733]
MSLLKWMGVGQAEPAPPPAVAIPGEQTPSDAASKMFGMENFGNTCYANSVLQALYFCQPFRDLVCVTPDGRPLPEIPIASLPAQVALPSPPPKDPVPPTPGAAPPTATPKPVQPGMGGPKLSFKRQNSTAPLSLSAVPGTPTDPSPALALSPGATAEPAADAQQVMRSIESLHRLPPSIFSALRALFLHISLNTQEKGMVSPSAFIAALKKENVDFRTSQHQDAHEFLNYLLNRVAEDIDENRTRWEDIERKEKERLALNGGAYKGNGHSLANGNAAPVPGVEDGGSLAHASTDSSGPPTYTSATPASSPPATPPRVGPRPLPSNRPTLIQSLFEGQLTNETRCLSCNTVSHRDETFLDLSIDIEPNSSVTACLREFSKGEMLLEDNRFRCDHCNEYCDAEKRMKVKTLPNILALHLKRFKYIEDANRNIRPTKLTYRVAFPLELRLFDTSDDAQNPDRLYELFAIVVHIGA